MLLLFGLASMQVVLELTKGESSPDCFSTQTYLVNGKFTGPTIYAKQGQKLTVTVNNLLNSSISIHFHGLKQKGSQFADGASGISNAPIPPLQSRTVVSQIASDEHVLVV